MQENRPNKHTNFVLDELNDIPNGFTFNSQHVWNGIEQKLPGKKHNKKWIYYAAAFLAMMACTTYFFVFTDVKHTGREGLITVKPVTVSANMISMLPVAQQKNKGKVQSEKFSTPRTKARTSNTEIAPEQKERAVNAMKPEQASVAAVEQITQPLTPTEPVGKEAVNKTAAITTGKPVAKKYRIIHLNELNPTALPFTQTDLSKTALKKIFQQQAEEKETTLPLENTSRQFLFFKVKPATTTTTIVEN